MFNNATKLIFASMLLTANIVLADVNYVCTNDAAVRKIDVVYTGTNGDVLCEVQYTKSGSPEVLWNAQSEAGYCEARAAEFVVKHEGWGWTCLEQKASSEG